MVIDVSSILKEFGGKISFDDKAEIPDLSFGGGDYHFKEPVSVKGSVSNTGGALALKLVSALRMQNFATYRYFVLLSGGAVLLFAVLAFWYFARKLKRKYYEFSGGGLI